MSEISEKIKRILKAQFPILSEAQIDLYLSITTYKVCKNKEVIIRAGSKSQTFAFILSGVMRGYIIDSKGNEINLFLRHEGSFVGSVDYLLENNPTKYTYESILECELLIFDLKEFENLCIENPDLYKIYLWGLKTTIATVVYRIESMVEKLPEERYEDLLKKSPIFFQKAFNKHIANYLGITPVSLSRIIKRRKEALNP